MAWRIRLHLHLRQVQVFVQNSWMVFQALIFAAVTGKIDVREEGAVHEWDHECTNLVAWRIRLHLHLRQVQVFVRNSWMVLG
jgi:hypothetical protein